MSRLDELGEFAREGARRSGATFTAPDDDWAPILIAESRNRRIDIAYLTGTPEAQAAQAEVVTRHARAVTAARVASTWITFREDWEAVQEYKRGDWVLDPDHREGLFVIAVDAERAKGWFADIIRDGVHPPTLGEWQESEMDVGGLQVEAIQETIRRR